MLWLSLGLYSQKIIAITEDQQIAITALENLPKITSDVLVNSPDFKDDFNEIINGNYGQSGQSYLPHTTPNNLIGDGKSKANSGKDLSNGLKQQAANLEQQGSSINEQQITATSKNNNEDLTPIEIVNKNLLDVETIPNAKNPATEAAFIVLEKENVQLQQELGLEDIGKTTVRPEYITVKHNVINEEKYEMGCSTTLLSPTFTCNKSLIIEVEKEPNILRKTITTSFQVHSYNSSSIAINFKDGNYRLISAKGGGDVRFSISDRLGSEFGANTIVSAKIIQANAEEGCHNTLNASPTFQNGFVATYSNYQPGTDDYHWHSRRNKKKAAKSKRNLYRGATLQYEFVSAQPPKILNEGWVGDCGELEDLTTLQECRLEEEICVEGEEIRQFGNQDPYLYVKRPCWKKRFTYHCNVPQGDNDCDSIPSNCIKTGSEFKEFLGQKAVEIHHFTCSKNNEFTVENITNNGFKAVDSIDYEKNNDFGNAVASLNLVKEIAKDVRQEGYGSNGKFFTGQAMHCTCKPKNCCADKKGFWRKMTGCKNEEIQLAERVKNGTCHLVDSYRVKKSVLQKIGHVEKQGYCCYQSKLSRVIQIGAKPQLNRQWGEAKAPQCEALNVEDLERIDWSQINFSEIADDFVKKAQNAKASSALLTAVSNNITQTTNKIQEDYQNNLPDTPLRKEQNQFLEEIANKIAHETARRKLHNAKNKKQAEVRDEKK